MQDEDLGDALGHRSPSDDFEIGAADLRDDAATASCADAAHVNETFGNPSALNAVTEGAVRQTKARSLIARGIARVNADTYDIEMVSESPVPIQAGGDYLGGRIYFASGSHVYSYHVSD